MSCSAFCLPPSRANTCWKTEANKVREQKRLSALLRFQVENHRRMDETCSINMLVLHFPVSWHITLNIGDVTVASVHLYPLLHSPGHDLLGQPVGVLQQHGVDLRGGLRWACFAVDQISLLAPRPPGFAMGFLCGVCILGSGMAPLGFDAPHALEYWSIDCLKCWQQAVRVFGWTSYLYIRGSVNPRSNAAFDFLPPLSSALIHFRADRR